MAYVRDRRLAAAPEVSAYLDAVFVPGARLGATGDETFVDVVEVAQVATIRVPTGRLVVDTPWPEERPSRELAVRIPPGTYRVEAAWTEAPYAFMGEHFSGRENAATRLCVADGTVAFWEMGLSVTDDVEQLQDGGEFGFATDTSMGGFADASAWPELTAPFARFWEDSEKAPGTQVERETEQVRDNEFEMTHDETRGADLITFAAAEGLSVVWLGRTETGSLSSIAVIGHGGLEALA